MFIPIYFWYSAFVIVLCGILAISLRNPVHSVLAVLVLFFHMAGLYLLLQAEFLAAVQIIVTLTAVPLAVVGVGAEDATGEDAVDRCCCGPARPADHPALRSSSSPPAVAGARAGQDPTRYLILVAVSGPAPLSLQSRNPAHDMNWTLVHPAPAPAGTPPTLQPGTPAPSTQSQDP